MTDNTQRAQKLADAIAYAETGSTPGNPHQVKGASGELASVFQFTPDTWKGVAGNLPLTPENEYKVATQRIKTWLDAGYSEPQIASMWNAGQGEPNAYTGQFSNGAPSKGTNKAGVGFDVPSYVNNVMKAYGGNSNASTLVVPGNNAANAGSISGLSGSQSGSLSPLANIMSVLGGAAGAVATTAGQGFQNEQSEPDVPQNDTVMKLLAKMKESAHNTPTTSLSELRDELSTAVKQDVGPANAKKSLSVMHDAVDKWIDDYGLHEQLPNGMTRMVSDKVSPQQMVGMLNEADSLPDPRVAHTIQNVIAKKIGTHAPDAQSHSLLYQVHNTLRLARPKQRTRGLLPRAAKKNL